MSEDQLNETQGNSPDAGSPSSKRPVAPSPPPPPVPVYIPSQQVVRPRGAARSLLSMMARSLVVLLLFVSVFINFYLGLIVYQEMQRREYMPGDPQNKIALIDLDGTIQMETASFMRRMLQRAASNDTVKGVILVVNSPGGEVVPSDMINRYVQDFQAGTGKPIYTAIEQVGASGAYWISAPVDKIYAQENAIVGSIGVISISMVVEQGLKEKLGITPIVIKSSRSPFKDRGSPFRMPTEEEMIETRQQLDTIHERFVDVVHQGRGLSMEAVWELASGDIFDGPQAKEKQLIDEVGSLEDAIDDMAQTLELDSPMVIRYGQEQSLREFFISTKAGANNPFDFQGILEEWACRPKVLALWVGN